MTDRFAGGSRPTLPVGHTRTGTVRVSPGLRFDLVVGVDEAGQVGDPLARYCLDRGRLPPDSLAYLALALAGPGDTVLDIGAHVGTFSLALASAGCRVVAVEAAPRNAALLEASVARNGLSDRLHVVHAAANDRPGTVHFVARGPHGGISWQGDPDAVEVPAVTLAELLDRLAIDRVDLIKVDVEGHEVEALEGLRPWLAEQAAPPILCEANHFCQLSRGRTAHAVKEQLRALGLSWQYRIDAAVRCLTPVLAGDFQPQITADYLASADLVTTPASWRLGRPARTADTIRAVLTTALDHADPPLLTCLARVLHEAPAHILHHPAIRELLARLAEHPDAAVREAVGGHAGQPAGMKDRATAWAWNLWARAGRSADRHVVRPLRSLTRRLAG